MKPGTVQKLTLLAVAEQTQMLAQMQRQHAVLAQITQQRGVLAAYRARLAQSWRDGAVVAAPEAIRAGQFAAASEDASRQIAAQETKTRQTLDAQEQKLAELMQRRKRLAGLMNDASLAADRQTERGLDRLQPPHQAGCKPTKCGRRR
jgi:flagellar biosynthesis chaperone FliJ